MPPAATRSAVTCRSGSRWVATTRPRAATTAPSAARTGTAAEHEPSVISCAVRACPRRRASASSRSNRPGSVIVYGVHRSRAATTRATTSCGEWASSTLPTPVACSGNRPPARLTTGTEPWPWMRSR